MNKEKEYAVNTLILLLGKFSTQIISLLLLPIYTMFLSTKGYGIIDLIQTYIVLLIPVLTLRLDSSVFRFLIDERKSEIGKKNIITNSIFILTILFIIFTFISIIFGLFIDINYLIFIILTTAFMIFNNIFAQIARGLGYNKEYAFSTIIASIIILITSVIFIVFMNIGEVSILLSIIISNFIAILFLIKKCNLVKLFDMKYINKNKILEMIKYSLPMIPNSLSWWIINLSDRTIITIFLSISSNGIYAVSCKFSNMISSLFSIFSMSWQETASININNSDKDAFFSKMINKITILFGTGSIIVLPLVSILFSFVIGKDYYDAYNYIPILVFSSILNVVIGLFGGIYIAKKLSKKVMNTTLLSAFVNIVLTLILIKKFGLYAASISTVLAYFVAIVYRYIDLKKYISLKLEYLKFIKFFFVFILSSTLYYLNDFKLNIINLILVSIYFLYSNNKIIKSVTIILKEKFKRLSK